jgi:hypothetical protein
MLVNSTKIIAKANTVRLDKPNEKPQPEVVELAEPAGMFVDEKEKVLTKAIQKLILGKAVHYYSYGNFNLVRLIVHLMKQTGPVNVFMTSYSFSQKSIEQLLNQQKKGNLLSFKVIVDNRVRSMSPKPFQMLSSVFNYRCSAIHAKVALLWNDKWKLSIVTSQNATDNPKMERGTIFTDPKVFEFDYKALTNEFNKGTT